MPLLNSFPGAEAAFSLRKLRSAHSGSAVRVRRDSDNAEQDIGFDGNDLDVDALESFCGSASGYVTKWYDQSGNSNDVLQTTAVRQPRIVAAGTVDTDDSGIPTVVFDGVDDYLLSASITTLTQENTYFAVATLSDASTGTRTLIDGDSARNAIRQTTTSYAIFAGSAISAGSVDTSQHVWSALFNGANSVLRVDGVSTVTGNPGVAGLDMVVVGAESDGSNPWIGKISEIIVYDGDSSADFALIEANQSQREFEGSPMNTTYIWRGAVEPAEAGASGNEIQLWRGAVEPAASAAAAATGAFFGAGLMFRDAGFRDLAFALNLTESQLRKRAFKEAQGSATWARFRAHTWPAYGNLEISYEAAKANNLELT